MSPRAESRPGWRALTLRVALILVLTAASAALLWWVDTARRRPTLEEQGDAIELPEDHDFQVVVTMSPRELAFDQGSPGAEGVEDVEASFTGAHLPTATRARLGAYAGDLPPEQGDVELSIGNFDRAYLPEPETETQCRLSVSIAATLSAGAPTDPAEEGGVRLRVSQPPDCEAERESERCRAIALTPEDGELRIDLTLTTPPENPAALGCRRRLRVGESWATSFSAPRRLEIDVPRNGEAVFRFYGLGPEEELEPFAFGEVRSFELRRVGDPEPAVRAPARDTVGEVTVERLGLLSGGGFEVALSGRGRLEGRPPYLRRTSFQEWVQTRVGGNPLLSIFVMGLIAWLSRFLPTYLVEKPVAALWKRLGEAPPAQQEASVPVGPEAAGSPSPAEDGSDEGSGQPGPSGKPAS